MGFHDEKVALTHRRLSIIDLSDKAAQPMSDSEGRYQIVFNGEIYNYKELKEKLKIKDTVSFRVTRKFSLTRMIIMERILPTTYAACFLLLFGTYEKKNCFYAEIL